MSLEEIVWERKKAKEDGIIRYEEQSRDRLMKILEKKFKTTFIGAIAEFEKEFGYLWGMGKVEDDLTDDELEFKYTWEDVRQKILDKGNHQSRQAKQELEHYTVKWNRYNYEFSVKNPEPSNIVRDIEYP